MPEFKKTEKLLKKSKTARTSKPDPNTKNSFNCEQNHPLKKLNISPHAPVMAEITCIVCNKDKKVSKAEPCYTCKECYYDVCFSCSKIIIKMQKVKQNEVVAAPLQLKTIKEDEKLQILSKKVKEIEKPKKVEVVAAPFWIKNVKTFEENGEEIEKSHSFSESDSSEVIDDNPFIPTLVKNWDLDNQQKKINIK